MYVAMPYVVFMGDMVSHLILRGTFLILGAHVSQFHLAVLAARVRIGHVKPHLC